MNEHTEKREQLELDVLKLCNKGKSRNCPKEGDGPLGKKPGGRDGTGSKEEEELVKNLQKMLKTLCHDLGNSGPNMDGIDGKFGKYTQEAVFRFQGNQQHKDWEGNPLEKDGLVGPRTADSLNRAMVGIWYPEYKTPMDLTKDTLVVTLTKDTSKKITLYPKDVKSAKIILANPIMHDPHDPDWQRWFDESTEMKNVPVRHGNKIIGLIDGEKTFQSMVDAIETATGSEHYIYMLNWWVELDFELVPSYKPKGNSSDTKLINLLSNEDVQVRAMFWPQWEPFKKNKDEVDMINKLVNGAAILDKNTLNFGSHHQKILIVKGEKGLIAFCGGVDFNPDRIHLLSRQLGSPMHDVHCRIEGPAAWDLLQIFVERWKDHPDSADLDKNKGSLRGNESEIMPDPSGDKHVQIGRTYGNGSKHGGITNIQGNPYYNFAQNGERTAEKIIFHAIEQAQRFIYIEDQYLINMDASKKLRAQLPKIEHLIILIPHSSISDLPGVWERRKKFIDLLKGDPATQDKVVVCCRIQKGSKVDLKKVQPTDHTYIHSKTFIIDDKFAIIGSANCNNRGYNHDSEVVAGIFDESKNCASMIHFAHDLRMRLWAEHLNLSEVEVFDAIESAHNWFKPSSKSSIAVYDQSADKDKVSPVELAADIALFLGIGVGIITRVGIEIYKENIDPFGG